MASGRTPLMAGNWKMNLDHLQATHLVQKLDWTLRDGKHDFGAVEVAVLPPFTDIRSVQTLIDGDRLELKHGAQDLSVHASGAYTGEISGAFLAKLGCTYVVVGHSERREYHQESDEVVNLKLKAAFEHGLTPIFCVGEGLEIRQAGTHVEHVLAQVEAGLAGITPEQARSIVVAYEPVWAIGTGEVATPEDAQEVCAAIRTKLAELYSGDIADGIRVLYGGSVKSGNVAAIMAQEDVDGALVGGASIDPAEFAAICRFRDHLATAVSRYSVAVVPDPHTKDPSVDAVRIGLQVLLVLGGLFLTLLILLHKGKGGGLSDMFGGGMSSSLGGSSVAERNLDRVTVAVALVWFTCVVGLGVIERFS